MNASQFYALAQQLQDAYACIMRPLCEKNGLAQTAMDILLFLYNNPGWDTAKDICTYRHLKPALVSLYVENLVQGGYLVRETDARDRRKCRLKLTAQAMPVVKDGVVCQDQFTEELLCGLSSEELAAWQRGLSVFEANVVRLNERGKKNHE